MNLNQRIVNELMTGPSPVGTLIQPIVVEGLITYCKAVLEDRENFLKSMEGNPLGIHGPSWIIGCEHIQKVINRHLVFDPTKAKIVMADLSAEQEIREIEGSQP